MTLYEIDGAISALVDPETGEISDFDALDELKIEREKKIENIALFYKNLTAEAEALKAEEQKLAERRKTTENKAARLLDYLKYALNGEKFKTARCECRWRTTQAVEVDDGFTAWAIDHADDLLTYKEPTPNKTAIKDAIKSGRVIQGAQLVENKSISVR